MLLRAIECGLLFIGLPLALTLWRRRVNPIPILVIVAAILTLLLYRDPSFDFTRLTRLPSPGRNLLYILMLLPVAAVGLYLLLSILEPQDRFKLLRKKPRVWATVMVLYPLFSVIP